jgi:phosphoserine phosphatase
MKNSFAGSWLIALLFGVSFIGSNQKDLGKKGAEDDPLPSWNEGKIKNSIIDFVTRVVKEGSADFIPLADRIATFDNDGTLWAEKPVIQELFMFYRAKKMIGQKPALRNLQPFKAIAAGDMAYLRKMNERDLIKFFVATQTGMTQAEYDKDAKDFYATAKSPTGTIISQLVYQPQVELLRYLRANGFKTFICSGGSVEFIRVISEQYYGIQPEQVIGTEFKYAYKDSTGVNDIIREPGLRTFNDKQEKPVNIQYHIGKRPVLACGNEGAAGDVYMLRFCQGNTYPNLQIIINHDDAAREFFYQEKDNKSLNLAKKYNWVVVSMKNDWKVIFPAQ